MSNKFTFVVVGGGIAGVSCVESLAQSSKEKILLISSSQIVKSISNFKQLTSVLESFDVSEKLSSSLTSQFSNITVVHGDVASFDPFSKSILLADGTSYFYNRLCICTGASPKVIAKDSNFVIGIRDTETVSDFEKRLSNSKRVIIVGNGGIATELVFKIQCCEVLWAVKDDSIISAFVDAGASKFLLPHVLGVGAVEERLVKRTKYEMEGGPEVNKQSENLGCALGPDWLDSLKARGSQKISVGASDKRFVSIEYNVEVSRLLTPEQVNSLNVKVNITGSEEEGNETKWPVYVELTGGKVYGCDFIVSATGVVPNAEPFLGSANFETGKDGGLLVDDHMRTSVEGVFAAGDVCTANWNHSPFWLQMRLWSQARQMGSYAARCMAADASSSDGLDSVSMDFCFELFAHTTKFFNFKVTLLGRFNGQGLNDDYKLLVKVVEGEQYVKVVLKEGRMVGAVLVGETDLEEAVENLILNQIDLSCYADDLLEHDIGDYFD